MNTPNGWPVINASGGVVPLKWITGRVAPDAHDVFDRLCERFHREVEPITQAHSWGWAVRNVRGRDEISNHASGTAIDLNAPSHPLGAKGTFTPSQVKTIHKILDDLGGVIRWGGDYTGRKDEMHFEVNVTPKRFATISDTVTSPQRESSMGMTSPIEGYTSSGYGYRSIGFHAGHDIATGGQRRPVYAAYGGTIEKIVRGRKHGQPASSGRVLAAGRSGDGSLIRNPDGERQLYGHVDVLESLRVGQKVKQGQLLGYVNMSGITTGLHLHFEVWNRNGTTRNPMIDFNAHGIKPGSKPKGVTSDTSGKPKGWVRGVKWVQGVLNDLNYDAGPKDGREGPRTDGALRQFQKDWGLKSDGIAGKITVGQIDFVRDLKWKPGLKVDGDYGQITAAADQQRMKVQGFYKGRIDGKPGSMHWTARKRQLKSLGYDRNGLKPATSGFGKPARLAEQTMLVEIGELPNKAYIDGQRGPITVKAIQRGHNKGKFTKKKMRK